MTKTKTVKRTSKMSDQDAKLIKKLGSLRKKEARAAKELQEISQEATDISAALAASLKEGSYQADSWVCVIKDKFVKGRESPKWKVVAEAINNTVDQVKYDLVQKYPESTSALNKFAKKIHKLYDETLIANTTVGEDKIDVKVSVDKMKKAK